MKKMKDDDLKEVDGGSTRITIRSQTMRNSGRGRHTLKSAIRDTRRSSSSRSSSSRSSSSRSSSSRSSSRKSSSRRSSKRR